MVPAKQGVYAIIDHGNLRQKASVRFVLEATFRVGVKTKTSNYKPCLHTGGPCDVRGVQSLPPQTKNPAYGPDVRQRADITNNLFLCVIIAFFSGL